MAIVQPRTTQAQTDVTAALPNDTYIGNQWAVQNTGQTVNGTTGTAGADERLVPTWSVTTGTNSVVVAVLDTGVQYSHPDLLTNMWNNPGGIGGCAAGTHGYNVLTSTCDPMDDDTNYGGHGSHVAGILGAAGNDAAGVAGVNWTTSVMAVKWVYGDGIAYTSDLITAMDWVISAKHAGVNVRVANDSPTWPGTAFSQALSDEIDALTTNDILFVTPAGNTAQDNDTTPRYPCSYNRPGMLCPAATDQNDNLWSSSNYGTTAVQLAAPGVDIYSTERVSNYGFISGTSMSAAQVSGTAALILSRGYQSVANLKSMILNSVDPLPSLSGFVATGGRLNVCKAVPGCSSASIGVPSTSVLPTVTGLPEYGSILGASTGMWSGTPTTFKYQWDRCDGTGSNCLAIPGATSQNYALLASADIGATLVVSVQASNTSGSASAQSSAGGVVASISSPFVINSTITNGQTVSGAVSWQASPAQAVNFVQFYIDGVLSQTVSSSPYEYNQGTTGLFDSTTLSNGTHVLGIRALSSDNRTYGFYGATVSVANSGGAGGGIVQTQSNAVQGSGVGSVSVGFPTNNTAGNLIIAFVRMSSSTQTVSVTDTAGNTYTDAVSQVQSSDGHQIYIFYAKNIARGANTVKATFSSTNKRPWLAIYEYSGLSTTSPLDKTAAAQGSSSTPSTGATAMTQAASELAFVGAGFNTPSFTGTVTAGTGYTLGQQDTNTSRAATETSVVSSTGSYTGTFTLGGTANWSAVLATFAAAGTATAPTITTASLPNGQQNSSYGATLAATGGASPYTWTVVSGALPTGLSLAPTTGVVSGTPTGSGTSDFTVQVTDQNSQTATKALSITINPGGGGGIVQIQSNAVEGSSVGSVLVGFLANNTAGNLIIAFVRMSSSTQTVGVTDTAGNTYTDAVSQIQSSDGHQIYIFYAKNIAGGANTVKATFSSTNNHPWLAIYEYSGLSTTSPLDKTAAAQGSSSTPSTGATAMTQAASELAFVGAGFNTPSFTGTVTAGTGYTLGQQDTNTSRAATETSVVSSTGSYTGTFTLSGTANWSAVLATFKP
jgi:hypothetical protein